MGLMAIECILNFLKCKQKRKVILHLTPRIFGSAILSKNTNLQLLSSYDNRPLIQIWCMLKTSNLSTELDCRKKMALEFIKVRLKANVV